MSNTWLLRGGPADGYRVANYAPGRDGYTVAWQDSIYVYEPSVGDPSVLVCVGCIPDFVHISAQLDSEIHAFLAGVDAARVELQRIYTPDEIRREAARTQLTLTPGEREVQGGTNGQR